MMKVENTSTSVLALHNTFCWNVVRKERSEDGEFGYSPDCQIWVKQLSSFVITKLGKTPNIRLHSYISGGGTYLAVDIFSRESNEYVALTIFMSGKGTYLPKPAGQQFDIALPGIVDGLGLVNALISFTQALSAPV